MTNRLLIATHNPGKINELKNGLSSLKIAGIEVTTLNDVGVGDEPEETGATFKDNALLKAKYYSEKTGLPTIADDGGLVIPYLNGEPGVKSSRWLGYKATDEELIAHTLHRLQKAKGTDRKAYLELVLCFYDPAAKSTEFETERISGTIVDTPSKKSQKGFPYRAILIVDRFNKYYDELSRDEHEKINHRLIALKRLTPKILSHFKDNVIVLK